jgi:hypothetical protein
MTAESGRSEHRNVDTKIPLARQRERRTCPNVPCESRTDPAEPNPTPRTDPKDLQNPRSTAETQAHPRRSLATPHGTQRQRNRAAASIGTSTPKSPSRDSANAEPVPTFPASADPGPRSPRRGTNPQRQPRHSASVKQVRAPGVYAAFLQNAPVVRHTRGFTPGWYAVPVGALRTPHLPRAFLRLHEAAAGPAPQSPTKDFAKETDGSPECVSVPVSRGFGAAH